MWLPRRGTMTGSSMPDAAVNKAIEQLRQLLKKT